MESMVSMVFRDYGTPINALIAIQIVAKHRKCNTK